MVGFLYSSLWQKMAALIMLQQIWKIQHVKQITDARWSVEVYLNREVKQTCGIERCQARTGWAQRNHIFLAQLGLNNIS